MRMYHAYCDAHILFLFRLRALQHNVMKLFAYLLLSSALTATSVTAQPLPDPVQTYFVPLPEQDLFDLFTDIAVGLPNGTVSGNVNTVISIAIAADNTIIYYDNWEDGFEAHAKERTQTTTQIWGDGDLTNGIAPGTTNDRLLGGMAIVLENPVVVTPARDPASIVYDGRDRIQASFSIAITRSAFPDSPGSLMAGAVEVVDFGNWGRRFIAPVGQNTIDGSGTVPFEYSRYFIMAGEDNTQVFRNGVQIGGVFNTGESTVFAVNQGDEVTSNRQFRWTYLLQISAISTSFVGMHRSMLTNGQMSTSPPLPKLSETLDFGSSTPKTMPSTSPGMVATRTQERSMCLHTPVNSSNVSLTPVRISSPSALATRSLAIDTLVSVSMPRAVMRSTHLHRSIPMAKDKFMIRDSP